MSVEIETPALSMSESLNSLRVTPLSMHRITFMLTDTKGWYDIMREARALYGKNWRGQPHVKRKLERNRWTKTKIAVWFEVPDPTFASWCAVKLAVEVRTAANK